MSHDRSARAWTLIGAAALALTVGVMTRRAVVARAGVPDDLRDAVAAPAIPVRAEVSYFASPASRRAEAEKTLLSSRHNRAASVTAQ
jgi:hypothetical protein